jgi:hypothetical protein
MDKKELYEKAEKAVDMAFKVARESAEVVSRKAGEAAQITKLYLQKLNLEHRIAKQFGRIGSAVYEKAVRDGKASSWDAPVPALIEETQGLEKELADLEEKLAAAKRGSRKDL